jgi:sulfur-carrier protein
MVTVSLHYWAGAKAAAGIEQETVEARTVAEALAIVGQRHGSPRLMRILNASSVLVDGRALRGADLEQPLTQPAQLDVLPPFAGGSSSSEASVWQMSRQSAQRTPPSPPHDGRLSQHAVIPYRHAGPP